MTELPLGSSHNLEKLWHKLAAILEFLRKNKTNQVKCILYVNLNTELSSSMTSMQSPCHNRAYVEQYRVTTSIAGEGREGSEALKVQQSTYEH